MPDDLKPGDIARTPSGCIVQIEAIQPKPSVVKLTYFDLRQVVARVNREPVRVDPSKLGWSRWCAIGRTVSYHEKWAEAVAAALAMCDARIEPSGGVLL